MLIGTGLPWKTRRNLDSDDVCPTSAARCRALAPNRPMIIAPCANSIAPPASTAVRCCSQSDGCRKRSSLPSGSRDGFQPNLFNARASKTRRGVPGGSHPLAAPSPDSTILRAIDPSVTIPSSFSAEEHEIATSEAPTPREVPVVDPDKVLLEAIRKGRDPLVRELLLTGSITPAGLSAALLCLADGNSVITERIFPERFMHVAELSRMGAHLFRQGPTVVVSGVRKLVGAPVMASDLRASASLVLAGLAAEGQTTIRRVYHLDRGYETLDKRLVALGARDCRFAVNDAAPGEEHLFCGHRAAPGKPYCAHHLARVTGEGTRSERNAARVLGKAA